MNLISGRILDIRKTDIWSNDTKKRISRRILVSQILNLISGKTPEIKRPMSGRIIFGKKFNFISDRIADIKRPNIWCNPT